MSTEFTNIEVFHASFLLLQMTRVLFCALATCFDEFGNGMGKNDNNFDAGSLQCGGNVCRFPVEKKAPSCCCWAHANNHIHTIFPRIQHNLHVAQMSNHIFKKDGMMLTWKCKIKGTVTVTGLKIILKSDRSHISIISLAWNFFRVICWLGK